MSSLEEQIAQLANSGADSEEALQKLMANAILANGGDGIEALQGMLASSLGELVGADSGYLDELGPAVKRRIRALKKIQQEHYKIECEMNQRMREVEAEFQAKLAPLYDRRFEIINGDREPADDECDYYDEQTPDPAEEEEAAADGGKAKLEEISEAPEGDGDGGPEPPADDGAAKTEGDGGADKGDAEEEEEEDVKGIPQFWFTTLTNMKLLAEIVQEWDMEPLEELIDVRIVDLPVTAEEEEDEDGEKTSTLNTGFRVEFHFAENEYFNNSVLSKTFHMTLDNPEDDALQVQGEMFQRSEGTAIDWKAGKNTCVKIITKTQKKKSGKNKGEKRKVTKTVAQESFFTFFDTVELPGPDDGEIDEELQNKMLEELEIATILKEQVVPEAVLHFCGLAQVEDSDEEGEEEEYSDEEEDEGGFVRRGPSAASPGAAPGPGLEGEQPADCKQQ